jgi:hypothetical protein
VHVSRALHGGSDQAGPKSGEGLHRLKRNFAQLPQGIGLSISQKQPLVFAQRSLDFRILWPKRVIAATESLRRLAFGMFDTVQAGISQQPGSLDGDPAVNVGIALAVHPEPTLKIATAGRRLFDSGAMVIKMAVNEHAP